MICMNKRQGPISLLFAAILSLDQACSQANFHGGNAKLAKAARPESPAAPLPTPSSNPVSTPVSHPSRLATPPKIRFGLLAADMSCTFCHLEVHGSIGSIGEVAPLRGDSHGEIFGDWLASGAFNARANLTNFDGGLVVRGRTSEHYDNSGRELPVDSHGNVTFPSIDFISLAAIMRGMVKSTPVSAAFPGDVSKVNQGNLILVGTLEQPIAISGDVLIVGDLIISGVYSGSGTIYSTGNIYIPANLTALHPASFPYPDAADGDETAADKQAIADISAAKDALGLAASNIFVGDLENYNDANSMPPLATPGAHGQRYQTIYDDSSTSDGSSSFSMATNEVRNVYRWYPELSFEELYQQVKPCWTATSSNLFPVPGFVPGSRAVSRIDGFLYASKIIGGVSRATNWVLNGGMIAQSMHIISGAGFDQIGANSPCDASRINFDYRMRNGLQILEALAPYFP